MSEDKHRVKVNTSKVKVMYIRKVKKLNDAIMKFEQMSPSQNYFFRSNEV